MHIVDCRTHWSVIGEPTARREWEEERRGRRDVLVVTLDTRLGCRFFFAMI